MEEVEDAVLRLPYEILLVVEDVGKSVAPPIFCFLSNSAV